MQAPIPEFLARVLKRGARPHWLQRIPVSKNNMDRSEATSVGPNYLNMGTVRDMEVYW